MRRGAPKVAVDNRIGRKEVPMNVLAINFTDDGNAYEALTTLKELDEQGQVKLEGAAVVLRSEDGSIAVKDEVGDIGYEGTATGGVIGLIVGILGGPIGVLVGGATGIPIGSPLAPHGGRA